MMSSQTNISDVPFDQKSAGHREVGVLNCHGQTDRQTDRQTDGYRDFMTELAHWADLVDCHESYQQLNIVK